MITFDSLIKLYTGIPCDFDGYYGSQCMDLMHFYKYLCLGIEDKTTLSAPTAYQAWLLNYPALFKKINNIVGDLNNFPVKGDIVFWDTRVGSAGHVAIITRADGMYFQSFDANSLGNSVVGSPPRLVNHSYFGVVGWLHPIILPIDYKIKYDALVIAHDTLTADHATALTHIKTLVDAVKKIDVTAEEALK